MKLGCLHEVTGTGSKLIDLPDGQKMQYLLDGDEVVLDAWCSDGHGKGMRLGFGGCRGLILPAAGPTPARQ